MFNTLLKDAVATLDVLIASNNEVKLVNTRTVHFARLKSSFCFKRINKLDRDYSYWEIYQCLPPDIPRDIDFMPTILKPLPTMAGGCPRCECVWVKMVWHWADLVSYIPNMILCEQQ